MNTRLTRRNFLGTTFAAGLGAAIAPWDIRAQQTGMTEAKKPNVVFFYVDDLGWNDVGYNGATYHLTPHIDAFAKKAMVFDHAYAMPTCSPSRVSLFTGMAAPRTGVYHVPFYSRTPKKFFKVKPVHSQVHFNQPGFTTLGETMSAGGYATGYVGKWHVHDDPMEEGFDFNAGGCGQGSPRSYFSPYGIPALEGAPEGEYLPERLLAEAQGFIRRQKDKPFFLFYAPYLVHRPLQARDEDIDKFRNRTPDEGHSDPTYAAMVEWTDRAFQGVLDTLEKEHLADDTVIILSSDNGINGAVGDATPLRGNKGTCYEGGVRVPTMVYWPGVTEAKRSSALVDVLDWYPTLMEIADAPPPPHSLDGVSMVPLLKGTGNTPRDAVYWHMPCYNGKPDDTQVWQTPFSAIRMGKYKLIHFYEDGHVELYDLEADIGERNNLADTLPEITKTLKQKLDEWLAETEAPRPGPLNKRPKQ